MTTIYILTAVFIISLTAFVGIFVLSFKEEKLKKIIPFLIALATGALLGGFFIHLLPKLEMMSEKKGIDFQTLTLLILGGILLFFIIEKLLHLHHNQDREKCESCEVKKIKTSGYLILFSDGFHNFLDGVAIASAFLVDFNLGIVTTIIIFAHELPQEIGDFGVLLNAGFEKIKALWFNFLSGLSAILGAVLTILASNFIQNIGIYFTALAGGSFIYLALASLIPELHNHKHGKKSQILIEFLFVLLGILIMWLIKELENNHKEGVIKNTEPCSVFFITLNYKPDSGLSKIYLLFLLPKKFSGSPSTTFSNLNLKKWCWVRPCMTVGI